MISKKRDSVLSEEPDDNLRPQPVILLLLDGWGVAPAAEGNAISAARTPAFLNLVKEYPAASLKTRGNDWNLRYLSLGSGRDDVLNNFKQGTVEQPENNNGADTASNETESILKQYQEKFGLEANLSAAISAAGKRQLKITDAERFASLTYFFNGGREDKLPGEDWQVIASPVSVDKIQKDFRAKVRALLKVLKGDDLPDFIVASLPYLDLSVSTLAQSIVGLSSDQESFREEFEKIFLMVVKAVETMDKALGNIEAAVSAREGILVIASAGGNAEQILNLRTDEADSRLTLNPVPFLVIGSELSGRTIDGLDAPDNDLSLLAPAGSLADLAPTILTLLKIPVPAAMNGRDLLAER